TFLLSRIGSTYSKTGEYLKAVEYCKRSIQMISENAASPSIKIKDIIDRYYWLSIYYELLNNFGGKMQAWDSCEYYAIKLHAETEISYIRVLFSKVEHYFDVGDYQNCIYYANRCRMLATRYSNTIGNKSWRWTGAKTAESSLGWEVTALMTINENDSAEKLLFNKLKEYKKPEFKSYLGFVYGFLAQIQLQKGDYTKAIFYFNKALQSYRETGNYFAYKQDLKNIGQEVYFKHDHDGDRALEYFREALKWSNKDQAETKEDNLESLSILTNMANVFIQKKQYDSAFIYFQFAFNQIKPGITEADILRMPVQEIREFKKVEYLTRLVIDKGDAYMRIYQSNGQTNTIRKAIRTYKAADELLDNVRMGQSDLNSKLFWRYDTRRLYEHAIEASLKNSDMNSAFYFFERSRASLLNDQLNEQRWLDEEDISRLTQIKTKILLLNEELNSPKLSADRKDEIMTEEFNKKKELEDQESLIKSKNPLYYQSFLDKTELTISDVQKKVLKNHQALVELFTGDSANYSLVITSSEVHISRINKTSFDSTLTLYLHYLSNPDLLNRKFDQFATTAEKLYTLIFQGNPVPPGRIIFSLGDRYFPVEALVTQNEKNKLVYFQDKHAVSYTYSARFLTSDLRMNIAEGSKDFMGVAPIHYQTASFSFPDLKGSDLSLGKIGSHFSKENILVGEQASRNNFLQQFSKYGIIQIYTHSSDSSERGEPVMYFSDSALYLSELIPQNKPITQLIVLSACETGRGREYKGEGIFNFNRGFAALGIPAAITNLWSVDDQATYDLTQLFYKYLAVGLPADIALEKAKLEYVKTSSGYRQLPYYWASAILVGKSDSILMLRTYPWKLDATIGVFAIVAFLLLFNWRKRKKISFRDYHAMPEVR
ncbi:MAG TPA: CHAT domain-containing tetratricopeptide repeat protein, partial [Puia sp.]|nr:CHAT domain-containing tetratricopeptide repeat protein [Puia sp.]